MRFRESFSIGVRYLWEMKYYSLVIGLIGFLFKAHAQNEIRYLNVQKTPCDSAQATYVEHIFWSGTTRDQGKKALYRRDGTIVEQAEYSSFEKSERTGLNTWYYPNGTKKLEAYYEQNKQSGAFTYYHPNGTIKAIGKKLLNEYADSLRSYYPNGKLKRLDIYKDGKRMQGTCYGVDGDTIPHFDFDMEAEYIGGAQELLKFIQNNVIYPSDAIELNIRGKVYARFTVDSTGLVRDIKIVKGVYHSLDQEVVRVIGQMPPWRPAQIDGEAISSFYMLPVFFSLDGGESSETPDTSFIHANKFWKLGQPLLDAFTKQEIIPSPKDGSYVIYSYAGPQYKIRKHRYAPSELERMHQLKFRSQKSAKQYKKRHLWW
jgi:protein TonB